MAPRTYSIGVLPQKPDVAEHVGGELADGARPQLAAGPVRLARHVLVQVEPVRQLQLGANVMVTVMSFGNFNHFSGNFLYLGIYFFKYFNLLFS
jgi:hypothetical protein